MSTFTVYLLRRLPLNEVSEYFPRYVFNDLFRQDCDKVLASEELTEEVRADLIKLKSLDLVGYVDSSLRRSGFQDFELDELVSDILVRLLVQPGSLFKKWDRKGIMSARLKVAIRNGVITHAKQSHKRARRNQELPDSVASRQCDDDPELVDRFRDELRRRFGESGVNVFDARLADEDIKKLIGSEGISSSYRLKVLVQGIKAVARDFGDECLQSMVARMSVQESETLAKRFGRNETVPTAG